MYLPASATHVARRGTSVITISALGVVALLGSTLLLLRSAEAGGANASVTSPQVKSSVALERNIVGNYGRLPLSFEMNTGQTDSRVRFLSRGSGYGLFLTSDSAILMLTGGLTPSAHRAPADSGGAHGSSHGSALAMEMKGASANATVMGVDALPGITNYLLGNEPRNWKTNITGFSRVKYKKLYPGVDLTYYGNHQQLEWDFTVAPGTSVGKIRMEFSGADKLRVNEGGDLVITTKAGEILFQRPITYQDVEGRRVTIGSRYRLMAKNEIAFQIDSYNTHLPLVIDPVLV